MEEFQDYYEKHDNIVPADILLMMVGRQIELPSGGWLVVGRNHAENLKLQELRQPDDWQLEPKEIPGPTAILRNSSTDGDLDTAASIVVRYSKKSAVGQGPVKIIAAKKEDFNEIEAFPLEDSTIQTWLTK